MTSDNILNLSSVIVNTIIAIIAVLALKNADKTLRLTRTSIDSAAAIFQLQNLPFLQVSDINIKNVEIGQRPIAEFSLVNLGQYPAKIIDGKFEFRYTEVIPEHPFVLEYYTENTSFESLSEIRTLINTYLIKETPKEVEYQGYHVITAEKLDSVNKEKLQFYLLGQITYINEVAKKQRDYRFLVKFTPPLLKKYTFIRNENSYIDEVIW